MQTDSVYTHVILTMLYPGPWQRKSTTLYHWGTFKNFVKIIHLYNSGWPSISRRGAPTQWGAPTYYLATKILKLRESEENWAKKGKGSSEICLCRSATVQLWHHAVVYNT